MGSICLFVTGAAKFRAKRVACRRRRPPRFTCSADGCLPGAAPLLCGPSARHPACCWGRRTAEKRGTVSLACPPSPPRLPEGNGQVSASLPHFYPARRGGCLRSIVTCHCRSCSFIKLCLLSAPAPPVLPFAGGRALGVNWFCAEGSCGGRERGVPLCRARLSLVWRGGLSEPLGSAASRGRSPAPLPARVGGAEAARVPGGAKLGFALQGARGARATGTVLRREGGGRRSRRRGAPGGREQTCALLGNSALFPTPLGVCLAGSLCHEAACESLAAAPGGTPPLRKERKLRMLQRDGYGASTRLRGLCPPRGGSAAGKAASEGAGGCCGARAPGRWSRGERRRRRWLISAEAVRRAEPEGAVRRSPVAPDPLPSGRTGCFRWMRGAGNAGGGRVPAGAAGGRGALRC